MPTVAEIELRRREAAIAHATQRARLEEQMTRLEDSIERERNLEQESDNG